MKHILVTVDFTDISQDIIKIAIQIAKQHNAKLCLLHIEIPEPDFVSYDAGPQCVRKYTANEIHENTIMLEQYKQQVTDAGVDTTYMQIQGATVEGINKVATKLNTDMIIIGSHRHGIFHHLLFGAVTKNLIATSNVPVLVIPSTNEEAASE